MPEIHIRYDLPSFNYRFVWEGTEAEAAALIDRQRARSIEMGHDPDAVVRSVVVEAPLRLPHIDAIQARGIKTLLTVWAFQLQSGEVGSEHPGMVLDYLPVYDFTITITQADRGPGGGVRASVEAVARNIGGVA